MAKTWGEGNNHKQLENSRIIKDITYNGLFCLHKICFTGRTSPSIWRGKPEPSIKHSSKEEQQRAWM